MRIFIWLLIFFIITAMNADTQITPVELTNDGSWCWFSDPRAIYFPVKGGRLVTGFVTEKGDIVALQVDLKTGKKQMAVLKENLESDDHDNPAFLRRTDGRLLAFYTKHHNTDLYRNISVFPDDASAWEPVVAFHPNGKADLDKFGDDKYTYANPFILSGENNRIYLFGRWTGFKPNFTWSDDGGMTWAGGRVIVSPKPFTWAQRPYVKYCSDGKDKIHFVFTDGHPRDEATNSVYYAYYTKGAFYRADGTLICTVDQLPFEPKDATLVYDAEKTGHRAWVYDLVADSKGNPAIAYARYPSETEHIYHYAWFDGTNWNDREICLSGKWFPQTPAGQKEREPHYSGGMTIDPNHSHTLYISSEVDNVFEIEKWVFSEKKNSWSHTPVTKNSAIDQVRPYLVKNTPKKAGSLLLWISVGRYIHYTDYHTSLMLLVGK